MGWKGITRSGYGISVMLSVHILLMYDTKPNDIMTPRLRMVDCQARSGYIEDV